MTNYNGVYIGTVIIDCVKEDIIEDWDYNVSNSNKIRGITFKVRLNNQWDYSWGFYNENYNRTENSQISMIIPENEFEIGKPFAFEVILDTTRVHSNSTGYTPNDSNAFNVWPVSYSIVDSNADSLFITSELNDGTLKLKNILEIAIM